MVNQLLGTGGIVMHICIVQQDIQIIGVNNSKWQHVIEWTCVQTAG